MSIRRAGPGDAETLASLNRFVHDTHLARRPDYFMPPRGDAVSTWFREQLTRPSAAAWIAQERGSAVGYVLVFFHERAENPFRRARRWCEIDQIAVDPARRRRGIGAALVKVALEEASARGLHDVELSSWAFNDEAHAMFRQLDFEPRIVIFERRAR